ncbi:hypothetical protein ACI1P2_16560 [Paenibacillus sp. p-8]
MGFHGSSALPIIFMSIQEYDPSIAARKLQLYGNQASKLPVMRAAHS